MWIKSYTSDTRPINAVPRTLLLLLVIFFCLQFLWHAARPDLQPELQSMRPPPRTELFRLYSLDDPLVAAKIVMLWLQSYDNQPGISIPFNQLDYDKVVPWLGTSLALDERGQYPLLAASRLYTQVPDHNKVRKMLDFVYRHFYDDPGKRWVWLAHGIYVAKYGLGDLELAFKFARALRLNADFEHVPYWARHMEVFILEDMGEMEAAKVLIGALLEGGTVEDANEIRFLKSRLKELEEMKAR